ncbi:MAG: hypothetical protein ACRDIU_09380, partial [Actinomycetota bacterium]
LRRPLAAGAVVVFGLLSFLSRDAIAGYEQIPAFKPIAENGAAAISFLNAEGLTRGYAGYWSSHALTLRSGLKVHFYPVGPCRRPVSDMLCPFYVNVRTAWYRPVRAKTFLLTDGVESGGLTEPPPPALGLPEKVRRFGSLTVYVYPVDIAGHFLPPCPGEHVCPGEPS